MNDTSTSDISYPIAQFITVLYYSNIYKIIGTINLMVILSLGIIGNFLVVIVVYFSRGMHTPTNCFLVSLSIADMITLLSSILPVISEYHSKMNYWRFAPELCPITVFLQFCSANASAMSITCFSFERWMAICKPLTAQVMCTLTRAVKIIFGIWVFNLLYNSSWLYLTTLKYRESYINSSILNPVCTYRLNPEYLRIVYLCDLIIFYITPLIVTSVLYIDIVLTLLNKKDSKLRIVGKKFVKESKIVKSKLKVIKMLITVVVLFAVLWLPYRSWIVYNSFAEKKYLDLWFVLFARSMVYVNSAINPILYNAMSAKFRKAFKSSLTCRQIFSSKAQEYLDCSEMKDPSGNPYLAVCHGK